MAKPKITFWTPERLAELLIRWPKSNPRELQAHFDRSYEDILRAHEFAVADRRLLISREIIETPSKPYQLTIYAAGYAKGICTTHLEDDEEDDV